MLWLLSFLIGLMQWIQNLLVFNSNIPGLFVPLPYGKNVVG